MRVAVQHSVVALVLVACHYDDLTIYRGFDAGGAPVPVVATALDIDSPADVFAHLDGKSMVMQGDGVPSHPNGYDQNINFGQATQCIHRVIMRVFGQDFTVETETGTLIGAPQTEDVGACDKSTPTGQSLSFNTTSALIENVGAGGRCFDITLTYSGFGQEGRGSFSPDGQMVKLELFFRDQAVGHRCAAGDVGSPSVVLNQTKFTGSATQLYRIRE